MNFDMKKIIGTTAPWLATALGGPMAGQAVSAISAAMGLKSDAKVDDIQKALAAGQLTGEQLIALKKAEQDFELAMQAAGFTDTEKLASIAAEDRASARNREAAVKDMTPRILAYAYTIGFFATLAAEIWIGVAGLKIDPLVSKSIDILLGILTGMVLGTKEYYFGSSSSSDKKTDLLAQAPPIQR